MVSTTELISSSYHSLVFGIIPFFREDTGPFKVTTHLTTCNWHDLLVVIIFGASGFVYSFCAGRTTLC